MVCWLGDWHPLSAQKLGYIWTRSWVQI